MIQRLFPLFLLVSFLPGCVSEDVRVGPPEGAVPPRLFEPMGTYPAGAYHGVNLFFEVLPSDVPDATDWMGGGVPGGADPESRDPRGGGEIRLPPIVPEILPGGAEVYRVRDIHRVVFQHSMFQVGPHSYPRKQRARLYVFKERPGNFSFSFRGQGVVVISRERWKPSIYYYPEEEREGRKGRIIREVVQVGFATIENLPDEGQWLVNGRPYFPDPTRPLELDGAVRAPRTP